MTFRRTQVTGRWRQPPRVSRFIDCTPAARSLLLTRLRGLRHQRVQCLSGFFGESLGGFDGAGVFHVVPDSAHSFLCNLERRPPNHQFGIPRSRHNTSLSPPCLYHAVFVESAETDHEAVVRWWTPAPPVWKVPVSTHDAPIDGKLKPRRGYVLDRL